jgi:hypothetical protein
MNDDLFRLLLPIGTLVGLLFYLWFSATAYKKRQERMLGDIQKLAISDAALNEEKVAKRFTENLQVQKEILQELSAIREALQKRKS